MKFLAVKHWWKHQHYHKRGAPWIKLYGRLLTDPEFLQLSEVAQAQLFKLWLLASQMGHPLPNNPKLLAGKIGTTGRFHLDRIIAAGFLIPCDELTRETLAENRNAQQENASESCEALEERREERGEKQPLLPTAAEAEAEATLALMLESDADRNALTVVVSRATNRHACLVALTSMLTGNDPVVPQPSPRVFGQALRDMATNGAQPTARKIRNYIADAARPSSAAPSGSSNGRGTRQANPGAQMVANILGGHGD